MIILTYILGIYALIVVTGALYVCSMQFKYFKDDLYIVAKVHAYMIGIVMIILDVILNILISPIFLELPRYDKKEFLLSPRLKRGNNERSGYRSRVAGGICEHFLNQFDRAGDHC